MAKSPLGRGLSALLSGSSPTAPDAPNPTAKTPAAVPAAADETLPPQGAQKISMDQIRPCSFQPRKDFAEDALQELAASIKSQGIVQPLVVRPSENGFELIAGERRWRAAQLAGLQEVPVVVREADDREVVELALVENLQRENLNPIEEAVGYQQLIDQFNLKQEQAAQKVGKSRAAVANALRLLKLPPKVQALLKDGELSVGHAKVILGLDDDAQKLRIAKQVIKDRLSVRETESLVTEASGTQKTVPSTAQRPSSAPKDPHLVRMEEKLCQRFSTRVALRYQQGKGAVELKFFNDEDLERIIQLLGIDPD